MKKTKMKILMTAAEAAPLAKVGGLADVVGSLPIALNKLGVDARIIIPKYDTINVKKFNLKKIISGLGITINDKKIKVNIWQTKTAVKNTTVYLIENKKYLSGKDIYDDSVSGRFLFFSEACLQVLPALKFVPDIIHCHDSHTAMIPALLKIRKYSYLQGVKTLYTIHNLQHQRKKNPNLLKAFNVKKNVLASIVRDLADGDINFMVQGIINADAVNTVSPSYSQEIMTKEYASGLEKVTKLYKAKISGILNGIDTDFFNPARDKFIAKKYSLSTIKNKEQNKLQLQQELGLDIDPETPLIGFISRLYWQKGVELITEKLIKETKAQFVFLGTGDKKYETYLKGLAQKYPARVSAQMTFDIALAQKIYASSDIFLMPSRFEPCGLGQMIAMRYGAVVVARETGGLRDTVNSKVGFTFKDFTGPSLSNALKNALNVYHNRPDKWLKLKTNCLQADFSQVSSARKYLDLYNKILGLSSLK